MSRAPLLEIATHCEFCHRDLAPDEGAIVILCFIRGMDVDPTSMPVLCAKCGSGVIAMFPTNERHEADESLYLKRLHLLEMALQHLATIGPPSGRMDA